MANDGVALWGMAHPHLAGCMCEACKAQAYLDALERQKLRKAEAVRKSSEEAALSANLIARNEMLRQENEALLAKVEDLKLFIAAQQVLLALNKEKAAPHRSGRYIQNTDKAHTGQGLPMFDRYG